MENPSYFAIIPANIRYCKELEPAAKLLYGEITALTSREGYCWASNHYFADLYGVDERTVTNWLKALKTLNFIKVETKIDGMQRNRKIWISPETQRNFTKGKNFPDVGKKNSPREEKNFPCINTTSNTSKEETPPTPSKGDRVSYGKFVSLSKEEFDSLRDLIGSTNALSELINEMNDYLSSTGKKPYKDYAAAIRAWWRRRLATQGSKADSGSNKGHSDQFSEGANRNWWGKWIRIAHAYIREGLIYDGTEYVSFSKQGSEPVKIYYRDPKFQEICENELRKVGLFA